MRNVDVAVRESSFVLRVDAAKRSADESLNVRVEFCAFYDDAVYLRDLWRARGGNPSGRVQD